VESLLNGNLCNAGKRLPLFVKRGCIADYKDLRMRGHREITLNAHPSGPVSFDLQPLACWGRRNARGPDHSLTRDALASNDYAILIDQINTVSQANIDSQSFESLPGSLREMFRESSENARSYVNQHNSR
jgi:hypothetical protein